MQAVLRSEGFEALLVGSYCLRVAKMELDFVAPGWQEPPEELKASPEATGSSEVERECHQGHAARC